MEDRDRILIANAIEIQHPIKKLHQAEFSVFSQWGDDGIIHYLTSNLDISNDFFVEFGVENYKESNTRFLMMNKNWSGFVMDGSTKNIQEIISSNYFWRYDLQALATFVSSENIIDLIKSHCPSDIGLLHIDIDGMDYWIWKEVGKEIKPDFVIIEYNSVFGKDRAISVPYKSNFSRLKAHHSGLYAGASLKAIVDLSTEYGYSFVGCNSAGNNAYFVRQDKMNNSIPNSNLEDGYVESKFRESRNQKGKLSYLRGEERLSEIKGMPIYNVETGEIENL